MGAPYGASAPRQHSSALLCASVQESADQKIDLSNLRNTIGLNDKFFLENFTALFHDIGNKVLPGIISKSIFTFPRSLFSHYVIPNTPVFVVWL